MSDMNNKIALISDSILLENETGEIIKQIISRRLEATHPMLVTGLSEGARVIFYAAVIRRIRDK